MAARKRLTEAEFAYLLNYCALVDDHKRFSDDSIEDVTFISKGSDLCDDIDHSYE